LFDNRNSAYKLKNIYIKYLYAFECFDQRRQIVSDEEIREMPFTSLTRTSVQSNGNDIDPFYSADEPHESKKREETTSAQLEKERCSKTSGFTSISREKFDGLMMHDLSVTAGFIAGESI
jgi:hypothetical protein